MKNDASFIAPCLPESRNDPPTGVGWLHEVRHDGWRLQLHRSGGRIRLFSIAGHDFTKRFPSILGAMLHLPRSIIVDAALAACAFITGETASFNGRHFWPFDQLRHWDAQTEQKSDQALSPFKKVDRIQATIGGYDQFPDVP